MGEKFNSELEKAEKLSKYNIHKASKLFDDLATAYISTEFNGLDKSLIAVKTAKKALRAQGIPAHIVNEFFIERSYLSKSQLRNFVNDSIYTEENNINPVVECIPSFHRDENTTDLIIAELKSRPELLKALQKGTRQDHIAEKFNVNNPTLIINFYNKNKSIIDD